MVRPNRQNQINRSLRRGPSGGAGPKRPKRPKRPPIRFSVGRPTTRPSRPTQRPAQNPQQGPQQNPQQGPQQGPATTPPAGTPPPAQPQAPNAYMNEEYLRTDAAETRRQQQSLASIAQQRQALGIGYGLGEFGGDIESNPYSRAALLQRNYERNQRASTNSMAAAGQLYAGSLSNARNFNRFNYDVSFDSMRKQYDAALARLNQQELQANTRYDDTTEAALRDAVNQGQEDERPEAWEAPPPQGQGGGAGGGQGGAGGGAARPGQVGRASQKRIKGAKKQINILRQMRQNSRNPKQRQQLAKAIKKQQTVVARNRQRVTNIQQGRPPNQGIKPRPKKGKR